MNNHYTTLGLISSATPKEIKSAFRKLSKTHHPDMKGGDAEKFAKIKEAYECLMRKPTNLTRLTTHELVGVWLNYLTKDA